MARPPGSEQPTASLPAEEQRLIERSVELVARWLEEAQRVETAAERRSSIRLHRLLADPDGVRFAMGFVDRVIRPEQHRTAAHQLRGLVDRQGTPQFLSPVDRILLRLGATLAPLAPGMVMPLAVRRLRALVGHLVVDARPARLARHLREQRADGFRLNVNLLGEAVLGDGEARRRHAELTRLVDQPDVDYVSVKVSALVSQLNPWDHDGSVERIRDRLRPLFVHSLASTPRTFLNLDMEEYRDLELTIDAFTELLDEPGLHHVDAGIALQTYLPDSLPALERLVDWATTRNRRQVDGRRGGIVKIRLVKGANLAMERVDAAMHGWEQAPYLTKADTDANYKRCLDWVLRPERLQAVRVGLASHNLFDVAWGHLLSHERGVADRVELEMLQGMASAHARVVRGTGQGLLLYTPIVAPAELDVAIAYLFRRLEENAAPENFIRHVFSLDPTTEVFRAEADRFATAVARRQAPGRTARRIQDRRHPPTPPAPWAGFVNEPDTDPALAANRAWVSMAVAEPWIGCRTPMADHVHEVDRAVAVVAAASPAWSARTPAARREVLHAVALELGRRRGELVAAMVHEGRKTVAEADPEVSEAVDFARWYGDRAVELDQSPSADFEPLGVVLVVPPWNFPVAIAAGGVLAALAAGNAVVLKPAPQTPRCAELVAECCWAAGVPRDVLAFVRTPDDHLGRHLVSHPDVAGVILTGSYDTATLFRSWRPDVTLFAETSGKNAMVITPNADIDLAVADLVRSAFGHAGQKCSAASLAVCVGDVYRSPRFRRQLTDAVTSLAVGPAEDPATTVPPVIAEPEDKLARALTRLDPGEEWLVQPRRIGDACWTPGVRLGVAPGSWFHQTECFGPVLGIMAATDLDAAIDMQNATPYGLTGGIHTLDPAEADHWVANVEVGNAYVNRAITGAIVARQPFGGWKRSAVGAGAKAGGPNYLAQLGTWRPTDTHLDDVGWRRAAERSDAEAWEHHLGRDHDPVALFCEANVFRYRPLPRVAVRSEAGATERELARVCAGADRLGVEVVVSRSGDETAEAFARQLPALGVERLRVLGPVDPLVRAAAAAAGVHVADQPVVTDGRIELRHFLREQAVSTTLHRYGNVLDSPRQRRGT